MGSFARRCRLATSLTAACFGLILPAPQRPAANAATGSPPSVAFVDAPAPGASAYYAVPFSWQGSDADGSVSFYRLALDPPPFGEPFWFDLTGTSTRFVFHTGVLQLPIPATGPVLFAEPHSVVLKAVDDEGLESAVVSRSFFTSNVAPDVQIDSPIPDVVAPVEIGSDALISWHGSDVDGLFSSQPVRYKWLLLGQFSPFPGGIDYVWANPDAVRQQYAPDFTDWFETSPDSATVHFSNLIIGQRYLFCVVALDEAGAYSARFTRGGNMILMRVNATPTRRKSWGALKARYR